MTVANITVSETPLVLYTLRRADDALILGHRLSEWCGHAPMLEEDMALANMGLDLLGQARELYSYAAKVEGRDNDEDKFAYLRDVRQYRNLLLWNSRTAISRAPWCGSSSTRLRRPLLARDDALARRDAGGDRGEVGKGSAYHVRHSSEWIVRLGDGTEESHAPRAGGDRRSLGLYRRDVRGRRQRARPDRCRHRGRSAPLRRNG